MLAVGYRRVACITGPQRATTAGQRLKGYERAHRAAGVGLDPHLVRHANFRQQGGYEAMESLLAKLDDYVRGNEKKLFRGFSPEELDRLEDYLDRLARNIRG